MANKSAGIITLLKSEILAWIADNTALLTNERDIQVKIAKYLESRQKFDNVYTEYRVPLSELKARGVPVEPNPATAKTRMPDPTFPWNNQMSVDIVVELKGLFAAVELKYATRNIDGVETIFGEKLRTDARILKNQAASNLTMYNFWKDVRRIEMLTSVYRNVAGGIALIISNSHDYWNHPVSTAKYRNFSLHEGNTVGPGLLAWNGAVAQSIACGHPEFTISGRYRCHWDDTRIATRAKNGDKFRYAIAEVSK